MKRYITLLSLGLCLAVPMLSQASDIKPFMHVTNVHNGQYDAALAAITDTKFYGPYQFLVLKDAIETQEVNNDGVRSLLAEFMYGWPLHNRTDMVLVTDYEDTRYYYNLQFYRDKLPEGIRIEQLRQMIMDAQFSYK